MTVSSSAREAGSMTTVIWLAPSAQCRRDAWSTNHLPERERTVKAWQCRSVRDLGQGLDRAGTATGTGWERGRSVAARSSSHISAAGVVARKVGSGAKGHDAGGVVRDVVQRAFGNQAGLLFDARFHQVVDVQ